MIINRKNRVVITGLGIITSIGETVTAFKDGLKQGNCGIRPISVFDTTGFGCQSAGQVKGLNLRKRLEPQQQKGFLGAIFWALLRQEKPLTIAD